METEKQIQKLREQFIQKRTNYENQVNEFFNGLRKLDQKYLSKLPDVYDLATAECKTVVPALYLEDFTEEEAAVAKAQIAKLQAFNEEALRLKTTILREANSIIALNSSL